ncbi:hypothetical protein HAPAU_22550 [Halalkalicoccus paucihalophilus]|uniref:Uncharacterized protein n=1 Tax=Halalkalicoccus paucihalophilus TaxID=1008153 RepID=A0A151AD42_9EURY|nr:hypothetical protein HAPAU_22550 [Halalkalicoccus paucihalophilus]
MGRDEQVWVKRIRVGSFGPCSGAAPFSHRVASTTSTVGLSSTRDRSPNAQIGKHAVSRTGGETPGRTGHSGDSDSIATVERAMAE